jgi:hypothetical protein
MSEQTTVADDWRPKRQVAANVVIGRGTHGLGNAHEAGEASEMAYRDWNRTKIASGNAGQRNPTEPQLYSTREMREIIRGGVADARDKHDARMRVIATQAAQEKRDLGQLLQAIRAEELEVKRRDARERRTMSTHDRTAAVTRRESTVLLLSESVAAMAQERSEWAEELQQNRDDHVTRIKAKRTAFDESHSAAEMRVHTARGERLVDIHAGRNGHKRKVEKWRDEMRERDTTMVKLTQSRRADEAESTGTCRAAHTARVSQSTKAHRKEHLEVLVEADTRRRNRVSELRDDAALSRLEQQGRVEKRLAEMAHSRQMVGYEVRQAEALHRLENDIERNERIEEVRERHRDSRRQRVAVA